MTHYRVLWVLDLGDDDDVMSELSGTVHRTRDEAQREIRVDQAWSQYLNRKPAAEFVIWPCDPVFLARCGECGDYPDDQYRAFRDWDHIADYTRNFPGWLATSERTVFCPRHLPAHGW
ncbi:hypothetical protein [Prauserella marina]|uniref:hypothetical protein n=1 Tax=Prauserella marina TaxID=530584 RepID=UPI00115FE6A2|nr:hypothetical protein [Prauserella marina]